VKPKAEHYSETSILTNAARLTIYTAQNASGKYYGGFALEWTAVGLANHRTALVPAKCRLFTLLDVAFVHQLQEARGYVERLRLNHLTDEQLAAILLVEEAIDKRVAEEALAEPVAPEVEQSAAAADVDLSAELQAIEWIEAKVECDLITRHPQNRDVPIPSVADLAESIRKTGRVLERVKLRDMGDGRYQMISGERRWKAVSLILEWETIDADVATMSDAEARALLTICNTQRQDLNDIEKAIDLQQLCLPVDRGGAGMTQETAGQLYGMSQSHVANLIRLLGAPATIQSLIIAGEIPPSFVRAALPCLQINGIEKAIAKEVAEWHKQRDEPGQPAADRTPSRDEFSDWLYSEVRSRTRSMVPSRRDWYSEYSAQSERHRVFDPTPEQLAGLRVITVGGWRGKEERAINTKLWDKLQKAAMPAAIAAWREKKKKKASGKSAKPVSPQQNELKRAAKLERNVRDWRREWLTRLLVPLMESRPIMIELRATSLTIVDGSGIAAAVIDLLDDRMDAEADDEVTPPKLTPPSVDDLALHYGIDIAAEWSAMQRGTKAIEFEMFFEQHNISQLERLARELNVHVPGALPKKQLIARLTGQHRVLPLPKSIAPLKPAGKVRKKK
jgi:ParB/RepB/Spo0J family partition protein